MIQIGTSEKPGTLLGALRHFTPETTDNYLRSIKWTDGHPACPKCGSVNVGEIASRRMHQCREKGCRKQFSVIHGTILQSTHLRPEQWVVAVWMIVNCRNGVSSCEIARAIGCKQTSAWHLLHRVRHLLTQQSDEEKLSGYVEADTTLIGGSLTNLSMLRRLKRGLRKPQDGKTTVHALRERKTGRIRASVIDSESAYATKPVIEANVEPGAYLQTDTSSAYAWSDRPDAPFMRDTVNHKRHEYVRGDCHVNGCESFFAYLRRSLRGCYIRPSADHMAAYVNECVWRFNRRKMNDWQRFDSAMRQIVGKRLTYADLTDGAVR